MIEQTKSRPRKSNDNGLVESKNGGVIRKHMGFGHITRAVGWASSRPLRVSGPAKRTLDAGPPPRDACIEEGETPFSGCGGFETRGCGYALVVVLLPRGVRRGARIALA
jgi:hypothetical protein